MGRRYSPLKISKKLSPQKIHHFKNFQPHLKSGSGWRGEEGGEGRGSYSKMSYLKVNSNQVHT